MALSAKQKQIVFQCFTEIVFDADSLFSFFIPNTKAQMAGLIEARVALKKTQLESALSGLPADTTARESFLNSEIAILDDLMSQI